MTNQTAAMTTTGESSRVQRENDKITDDVKTCESAVLHRHLDTNLLQLDDSQGNYLITSCGRKIFDASGGAAVASIGWGNERVINAIVNQLRAAPYSATINYTTRAAEELCRFLVESTDGHMSRAYIVNSGSEAMEAALKLARQYFLEKRTPEPQRTRFIARRQSYHGITLGALSVSGHKTRRAPFEPLLSTNVSHVSPCYAYRGKHGTETEAEYIARLAKELDDEFQRVGPDTVCAFLAEPIVGAALGCVPSVPGYFAAVREVCDKYGALLILDEVMCGMGRSGTLHAWKQEGVAPDIQTIGKCLGGGYQPIAGVLASHKVVDVLAKGTSVFVHGHTFQGMPVCCAAALEVQKIVQEDNLLENVKQMGWLLEKSLREKLSNHPNVGDIRGRGLFWGVELVADKQSRAPLPLAKHTAMAVCEMGLSEEYSINVYPAGGTAEDGVQGDALIIAPPFNVTAEDVEMIASKVSQLVGDYFTS